MIRVVLLWGYKFLTTGAQIYNWGQNGNSMLGRGTDPANPGTPTGIAPTDEMIALESGGHTSMYVKKCEVNFGYVGHRINGSMGNGDPGTAVETSVTYATANVAICAADAI
jgi:alpha-tubulin suppressor-like RCC1 family protein